jgi:hypothetical protein
MTIDGTAVSRNHEYKVDSPAYSQFLDILRHEGVEFQRDFGKGKKNLRAYMRTREELEQEGKLDYLSWLITAKAYHSEEQDHIQRSKGKYFPEKNPPKTENVNVLIENTDENRDVAIAGVRYWLEKGISEFRIITVDDDYQGETGQFLADVRNLKAIQMGLTRTVMKSVMPRGAKYILGAGGKHPLFPSYGEYPNSVRGTLKDIGLEIDKDGLYDMRTSDFYPHMPRFIKEPVGIPEIDDSLLGLEWWQKPVFLMELKPEEIHEFGKRVFSYLHYQKRT